MHLKPKYKWVWSRFAVASAQSIEPRGYVENEDVVRAAPIGDAPTTSKWSTITLPTEVQLILEVLRYCQFSPTKWTGAGGLFLKCHHQGCLNNLIFSNLWLCAAFWVHFMCHHEFWPTSVSDPFSSLDSFIGLAGAKHYHVAGSWAIIS